MGSTSPASSHDAGHGLRKWNQRQGWNTVAPRDRNQARHWPVADFPQRNQGSRTIEDRDSGRSSHRGKRRTASAQINDLYLRQGQSRYGVDDSNQLRHLNTLGDQRASDYKASRDDESKRSH